ncbi:MAG: hypothetical protein ACI9MR_004457 [Myxococcota bacterium]|jgi:hypothetical protein
MTLRLLAMLALLPMVGFGGCAEDAVPGLSGPSGDLEIAIAPLMLADVADACFDIEVKNESGERVFATRITSQRNGNGTGDATYIGTCDASDATNDVELDIVGIYADTATCPPDFNDGDDFDSGGLGFSDGMGIITVTADCNANADTLVAFDVTILRNANRGFFDIAVNFNDMYCSAKFDTCYGDAPGTEPIMLLAGATGERQRTGVAGLSCTAGTGATGTELVLLDPTVTCTDVTSDDTVFAIDLGGAEQDNGTVTVGEIPSEYSLHYALFYGNEDLGCGVDVGECQTVYYNMAINIEDLESQGLSDCRFDWAASARHTGSLIVDGTGALSATSNAYPTITYDSIPANTTSCQQHPLNGNGSSVATRYIEPGDLLDDDTRFNTYSTGDTAVAFDDPQSGE